MATKQTRTSRLNPARALGLAALSFAGFAGCYTEGGSGFSTDTFTYVSTSWQPKTISLVDTRTGETVWSVDVPVEKKAVVRFRKGQGPDQVMPDMMYWGILDASSSGGTTPSRLPCPAFPARLLVMTLHPVPEMPGAVLGEKTPPQPEKLVPVNGATPTEPAPH